MSNLVFDFGAADHETAVDATKKAKAVCTYTPFASDAAQADEAHPFLVLDNRAGKLVHHTSGLFEKPEVRSSFVFMKDGEKVQADVLEIDSRFLGLLAWLGSNGIMVRLSGKDTSRGYCVYKIREVSSDGVTKLSAADGFLQYVISRLLETKPQEEENPDEDTGEDSDEMKLTSLQSMTDFLECAKNTLPANIRKWARRNLAVAKSSEVSPEERRHAQHALSIMLNIRWRPAGSSMRSSTAWRRSSRGSSRPSFRSTAPTSSPPTGSCWWALPAPARARSPMRLQGSWAFPGRAWT